jgi:hypothetical protein
MLVLQAVGSNGEKLAGQAAEAIDVPVGWDAELQCATFDSDEHASEDELRDAVFAALARLDPDWQTHLQLAD